MGIFDRVSRLIKSNANAALDKLEDPGKQVEQLVVEMEDALRRARAEVVEGAAAAKLAAGRVGPAEQKVAEWARRVEQATQAGDAELANEAREQQRLAEENLALARREQHEAAETTAAQRETLKRLEARLAEVKAKKGTVEAKVAMGRNQQVAVGALDDYERMAGRVDDAEYTADAERELAEETDSRARDAAVDAKLAKLEPAVLDDRLAALKRKMDPK